ncbi:metallophosphoesterase family protein [Methanolobus sp. ZRKC2]|uniref:metallophosphoesterase family protein n=1 Tax=Methanolobus sp. ZRKC2 TaxID=3125783 RepID=UPI00324E3473
MRLLLISDIHANKEALDAVLKVPHDEVFCLGDIADYGPSPSECIALIRENNIETVLGNHDAAVGTGIDCGCGYKYKHLSIATREYTWNFLAEDHLSFLRQLPFKAEKVLNGQRLYFTHGSPQSNYEYIRPETPDDEVAEMIKGIDADFIFTGHSHQPMVREVNGIMIINPGSVGQPRDLNPLASCAVFNTETRDTEIIRCSYDIENTCNKIRERMPNAEELISILMRGY